MVFQLEYCPKIFNTTLCTIKALDSYAQYTFMKCLFFLDICQFFLEVNKEKLSGQFFIHTAVVTFWASIDLIFDADAGHDSCLLVMI